MRINLPSLLAQRPIAHPSRVERVVIIGNRLELVVSGYAWWAAGSTGASSPQITLVFEKTSAGLIPACFDQEHDDEHLDNFLSFRSQQ